MRSPGIARRDGVTRDRPGVLIRTRFDDSGRGPLPRLDRGKLHLGLPAAAGRPPSGLVSFAPASDVRITPRHDARGGEILFNEVSPVRAVIARNMQPTPCRAVVRRTAQVA